MKPPVPRPHKPPVVCRYDHHCPSRLRRTFALPMAKSPTAGPMSCHRSCAKHHFVGRAFHPCHLHLHRGPATRRSCCTALHGRAEAQRQFPPGAAIQCLPGFQTIRLQSSARRCGGGSQNSTKMGTLIPATVVTELLPRRCSVKLVPGTETALETRQAKDRSNSSYRPFLLVMRHSLSVCCHGFLHQIHAGCFATSCFQLFHEDLPV